MAALRAASSRAFLASSLSAEASAGVSQPLYACTNRSRQPALERLPPRPSDRASVRADAWPPHRPAATTSSSCGDTVPRRHRARRPGEQSAAPVGRASTAKTRARRASTVGGGTHLKLLVHPLHFVGRLPLQPVTAPVPTLSTGSRQRACLGAESLAPAPCPVACQP
jgi:hypothetical protein